MVFFIILWSILIPLSFFILAHTLVFFKMGTLVFLTPIEALGVLREPAFLGEISTVVAVVLAILFFWQYIKSEYAKYIHNREHKIYSVTLSELAHIWRAGNIVVAPKETIPVLYLKNFDQERTKEFVARYMEKNIRFFPQEKLEIIFELFKILEKEAVNVPSVASKYKNDPEKTGNYQSVITPDGKRTYDVYSEVTLYNHTINVAEKAIEFLKEKDPISFETIMCDGIIVALAHDIGKLHQITQFNKEYPDEILTQNPHQAISKMFFSEMWPGYLSIEDAIYNHHSAPNSIALLTRMIIVADKEARKFELLEWQTRRSEEKKTVTTVPVSVPSIAENEGNEKVEDSKAFVMPTVEVGKKSRTKKKQEEQQKLKEIDSLEVLPSTILTNAVEESEEKEPEKLIVAPPSEQAPEVREYDEAMPIDYNDEIEEKIIADLRVAINQYTLEKPQGIQSISYDACVLFSVTHFNNIVKKHIYTTGDDPKEIKRIGMFISSKFFDKGYTHYMSKDAGCSTFFIDIDQKKFKYFCVPIKAEVFNMNTFELDALKDHWMKKIIVTDFRSSSEG